MVRVSSEGLLKGLGVCVIILGFFILTNIALLTRIHVSYFDLLGDQFRRQVGAIWLKLAFEPTSGAMMGLTLIITGMGMFRLRKWARQMALALMYVNIFALGCWVFFTQFQYITMTQFVQISIMYALIVILLNLKWIRSTFS